MNKGSEMTQRLEDKCIVVAGAGSGVGRASAKLFAQEGARVVAMVLLCSCTAQQTYEGMQQGKRNECAKLPQSQQAQCLEEANISYAEYQRRRRQAMTSP
jgi:NAD(P)-dependent dehydrogenase (short-subunit alcohol dehydrogenase family)